jgi:hypothetical protein
VIAGSVVRVLTPSGTELGTVIRVGNPVHTVRYTLTGREQWVEDKDMVYVSFRCPLVEHVPVLDGPLIYLILEAPELSLHRVKVGWTSNLHRRMSDHRGLCPTLMLVGLWPGGAEVERWAKSWFSIRAKRVNVSSEVFDLYDTTQLWSFHEQLLDRYGAGGPAPTPGPEPVNLHIPPGEYSTAELAELTGMSLSTILGLVTSGALTAKYDRQGQRVVIG